jgi:hypothetical protein
LDQPTRRDAIGAAAQCSPATLSDIFVGVGRLSADEKGTPLVQAISLFYLQLNHRNLKMPQRQSP